MEKRIIVSQTCSHCYQLLHEIYERKLFDRLVDLNIKIDMLNRENEYAMNEMEKALKWLEDNVDSSFGDQESVTPIMILKSIDGIEEVVMGSDEIISVLKKL